jgi:hypothetical protein
MQLNLRKIKNSIFWTYYIFVFLLFEKSRMEFEWALLYAETPLKVQTLGEVLCEYESLLPFVERMGFFIVLLAIGIVSSVIVDTFIEAFPEERKLNKYNVTLEKITLMLFSIALGAILAVSFIWLKLN